MYILSMPSADRMYETGAEGVLYDEALVVMTIGVRSVDELPRTRTVSFVKVRVMLSVSSPLTTWDMTVCTQADSVHWRAHGCTFPVSPVLLSVPMKVSLMIVEKGAPPFVEGNFDGLVSNSVCLSSGSCWATDLSRHAKHVVGFR